MRRHSNWNGSASKSHLRQNNKLDMLFAMPRKAEWWQHIPFALEQLRSSTLPVIDRAGLETLLNVHRRDAIRLMHRFGGYQAGRTFLIDRVQLIARLEHLISTDDYSYEKRRWV